MKCEKCNQEIKKIKINKSLIVKRLKENYYKFFLTKINVKFQQDLKAINFDLSEANLSGIDLSDADLDGINLSETNLRKANLSNTGLSGTDLRGTDLNEADLSETNLSYADLRNANLNEVYYWKTNFKYCKVNKKVKEQIIKSMQLVLEEK